MKKNDVSFVRLDNANLLKMTLKDLAKNFAIYSQLIIDIKKIEDEKETLEKDFMKKLGSFEKDFKELKTLIPKKKFEEIEQKNLKDIKEIKKVEKIEKPKMGEELKTLLQLKKEFEKIQDQLHEIKSR